jgi:hypothetical protein
MSDSKKKFRIFKAWEPVRMFAVYDEPECTEEQFLALLKALVDIYGWMAIQWEEVSNG